MNYEVPPIDLAKAIQAAGVLLRFDHGEKVGILRLMKLLYIADREALKESGRTITGDRYAALDNGPILSTLYNIIKDEDTRATEWRKYVDKERYWLTPKADPGVGQLSRFEVRKLNEVATRFAGEDVWEIVKFTHTFPEWKDNAPPEKSSKPIPLEDILKALGMADEAERIKKELSEEAALRRLLSTPIQSSAAIRSS